MFWSQTRIYVSWLNFSLTCHYTSKGIYFFYIRHGILFFSYDTYNMRVRGKFSSSVISERVTIIIILLSDKVWSQFGREPQTRSKSWVSQSLAAQVQSARSDGPARGTVNKSTSILRVRRLVYTLNAYIISSCAVYPWSEPSTIYYHLLHTTYISVHY